MIHNTPIADARTLSATTRYTFRAESHKVQSVHTWFTASAVNGTLKLQWSNDPRVVSDAANAVWEDYATATNVTASGSKGWGDVGSTIDALYWAVLFTRSSGDLTTFNATVANTRR